MLIICTCFSCVFADMYEWQADVIVTKIKNKDEVLPRASANVHELKQLASRSGKGQGHCYQCTMLHFIILFSFEQLLNLSASATFPAMPPLPELSGREELLCT